MSGGKFKGDVRGKFFTQRVVGVWNALPGVVVETDTIGRFKGLLDKHMNMQGIEGYGAGTGRRNWFNLASCSAQHPELISGRHITGRTSCVEPWECVAMLRVLLKCKALLFIGGLFPCCQSL